MSINEELNVTAISRKTKLNHSSVKHHLKELQQLGIIHEKRFGRIRIFKINNNNEPGWKIKEFLGNWNNNKW